MERGRLSLGASTSIGAYLPPPVLAAVHRAPPAIESQREIGSTETLPHALEDGDRDRGFTEGSAHSDARKVPVFHTNERVFIVAPDYPPLLNDSDPHPHRLQVRGHHASAATQTFLTHLHTHLKHPA